MRSKAADDKTRPVKPPLVKQIRKATNDQTEAEPRAAREPANDAS
jgi:hypothetical protein